MDKNDVIVLPDTKGDNGIDRFGPTDTKARNAGKYRTRFTTTTLKGNDHGTVR